MAAASVDRSRRKRPVSPLPFGRGTPRLTSDAAFMTMIWSTARAVPTRPPHPASGVPAGLVRVDRRQRAQLELRLRLQSWLPAFLAASAHARERALDDDVGELLARREVTVRVELDFLAAV